MAETKQTKQAPTQQTPAFTIEESKMVPPGDHIGDITRTSYEERGDEGFAYLDVYVKERGSGVEIKVGYPANKISTMNELGQLLGRFGHEIKAGIQADLTVLNGAVRFTTQEEKTKRGTFSRIIPASLRPLEA